ncbi:MAG TPA: hypothetical protein VM681_03660 [Candidatus Thermoplasmatota archaeon]|nr:hypothetical protein [Candidatus Thermoplasmatota archaeon]
MTGAIEGFLGVAVLGLAALLTIVAVAAHRRIGGQRLAIFAAAFAIFAVKGALYVANQFTPIAILESWPLAFDFVALLLLYFGTLR